MQAVADGLMKVLPPSNLTEGGSSTPADFSCEEFLAEHSLEAFCELVWSLADHVVNKRLQEPKMFKVHVQMYVEMHEQGHWYIHVHVPVYIHVHCMCMHRNNLSSPWEPRNLAEI